MCRVLEREAMNKLLPPLVISLTEARKIALYSQGLSGANRFGQGVGGALSVLEHLGYVQIDTISVVARAHHHVFWSRLRDYKETHLAELIEAGQAFEYWSHAASYLPMRDFRFSLPRKRKYSSGEWHWFQPDQEHKIWRKKILARIKEEGALTARDFLGPEGREKKTGWFERSPAKKALEQLFMEGKLMISGRQGFQKNYDLTERVLPPDVCTSFPTPREHARHLIESSLRSHGFARAEEISYLRSSLREEVKKECARMERNGELRRLAVEGIEKVYFFSPNNFDVLRSLAAQPPAAPVILSPFDSHVIQRKRLQELFGFDYLIECYVPEAKRKYGYFSLPLLQGEEFVGRLDAKARRAEGVLEVKSLHPHGKITKRALREKILTELEAFAEFNGCQSNSFTRQLGARVVRA